MASSEASNATCLHDVTANLLFQNNEKAANYINPVGVELFSYVNTSFGSNNFTWLLAT